VLARLFLARHLQRDFAEIFRQSSRCAGCHGLGLHPEGADHAAATGQQLRAVGRLFGAHLKHRIGIESHA